MKQPKLLLRALLLSGAFLFFGNAAANAGSATWNLNPATNDWNTATNWAPNTVPNGPADTATFADSDTLSLSVSATTEVASITFASGASPYLITINGTIGLTVSGAGIADEPGSGQTIFARADPSGTSGVIFFTNQAAVADPITFITEGNSTANFGNGGVVSFADNSSVTQGTFVNKGATVADGFGGRLEFFDTAQAVDIGVTNEAGATSGASGGFTSFEGSNSIDGAVITSQGASVSGAAGGLTLLAGESAADNSSLIAEGSSVSGGGGAITLTNDADTGNSTLTATSGSNGGEGGTIKMIVRAQAAGSRVILSGNGTLDTTALFDRLHETMIGSLEGDGIARLGNAPVLIGSNNASTTFSGLIQDGDAFMQGKIVKIGTGTMTLSGANTYTGTTTVSQGVLLATNTAGSATGPGPVSINAGTLGGSGVISGAVIVGTESGSRAFLAPAFGSNKQVTLTLQGSLTLQADATYTYTFKARKNQSRTDLVVANGVTINGASIALQGKAQGTLQAGLVLTVIRNTAASAISGRFHNLADGAIVNVNGNNLQASYTGGDGNDLTLTVVP